MNKKPWAKTKRLALTLILGAALFLLWLLAGPAMRLPVARAIDRTVCLEGPTYCDYTSIQAAVDAAITGDVIKVAAGVYTGTNSYGGTVQMVYISKTVTIRGGYTTTNWSVSNPDTYTTTLDADGLGRVMYIASSTSAIIENISLTGGNTAGNGGGIYHDGDNLALNNTFVFGNTAALSGGGIYNDTGSTLSSLNSTVSDNSANANGGGILSTGGTFTSLDSTVSDNTAAAAGGGMYISGTVAALTGSTVSGNSANGTPSPNKSGGGIVAVFGSTVTINNSTISGNSANDDGAGIYNNASTVSLVNVTISNNAAASEAGGIENHGTFYLNNTIIAGNTAASDPDCRNLYGAPINSQGYNLIQTISSACTISGDTATNITGQDPLLDLLADNGGNTETHALLPGSPAINAGTCVGAPPIDQRGVARPQAQGCDIGAYEAQTCFATPDDGATIYSSVQQAVDAASPGNTVKVAGYCSGVQTRSGLLQTVYVSKTLTMRGGYTTTNWMVSDPDTYPARLDALGMGRVVYIASSFSVTIENLSLIGGNAADNGGGIYIYQGSATLSGTLIISNTAQYGGGIYSNGTLVITNSTVLSNTATGDAMSAGGGIYVSSTTFTAYDVTVRGNTAYWRGGGIFSTGGNTTLRDSTIVDNSTIGTGEYYGGGGIAPDGPTTIINCTISGNTSAAEGGGIRNGGDVPLTILNSTLAYNTAAANGGGIRIGTTNAWIKNSIFAGNTSSEGPDCRGGNFTSAGYNLIQDTTGCIINGDLTGNITGQPALLGPLQDNGGPTWTHALLPGSPAIDAGSCVGVSPTDQRGSARPQGAGCDIGAYETSACYATPNDGTTVYNTVQEAVDAAGPGGTVKVAGYCSGVQPRGGLLQTVYVSKTLTVRGGYTTANWAVSDPVANPTTLDALDLGRVMVITGTIAPTVEGLRITGGDATMLSGGQYGFDAGGGIYVHSATATINNCVVYSNTASTDYTGTGGGVFLHSSSSTLTGNTVISNTASSWYDGAGGGVALYLSAATLEDNTIQNNIANNYGFGLGGGVYLNDAAGATLINNTVQGNIASTADWGYGGGIYITYGAATLVSNTIQSNTASTLFSGHGGGVCLEGSPSTLTGNTIISNTASIAAQGRGGGISADYSDALIMGNTIQGNTASVDSLGWGGGLDLYDSAITLTNNIVVNNIASSTDDGWGGGVHALHEECSTCGGVFEGNSVMNNVASATNNGWGGGLYIYGGSASSIVLTSNTVVGNTATLSPTPTGEGGGVWIGEFWGNGTFTMTNNLVTGNHATTAGSGLYISGGQMEAAGQLLHNTIADNAASGGDSGQGVYVGPFTTLVFTNTIVAGHASAGITVTDSTATVTLEGTLWHNNAIDVGGMGTVVSSTNVYGDPAFANPSAWDYHLTISSLAVDAGVDTGVTTDFEGDSRPLGSGFDIGYDESPFTVQADVSIVKSVTPGVATPNQVVTYTLTFVNAGPHPALDVLIIDRVPITLTNISYTNTGAVITPTGSFSYTWEVADLAPGQGGVITVTGTVATSVSGVFDLYNQVEITTTTYDPAPLNNISTASNTIDGIRRCYLPMVYNNYIDAPDLIVEQIIVTENSIQVVVKNEGNVKVTESFWVDVYINPDPIPTHVNQTWPDVASQGLVWGVIADLEPGEVLTLTVGGAYYKPQFSNVSWPLAVGTVVYAQVDSYNIGTTYGRVLENHEVRGAAYNNISHVTVQTLDLSKTALPAANGYPLITIADLPPESKKQMKLV